VAGPWYVLADQFLENGESTIRNLSKGINMIEKLGGRPMKLGYVPDSFGSISSLPMILKGFNINYTAFGRGRPYWNENLPKCEFWWEGPDKSKVLTASHGYGNGTFLSYLDIWTDIMQPSSLNPDPEVVMNLFLQQAKQQQQQSATDNLYFSVGCDHMEPRKSLPSLVKYINEHQDEYQLIYGTPEDYIKAVESDGTNLAKYTGEMRGSDINPMDLAGTLSSYMQLKQENDKCEILLQREVEPLMAIISHFTKFKYPTGHLRKMWKLLLSNHPHDSICGCSLDQVHEDMLNRFEQIKSIGSYLIKDGLHHLLAQIDTTCSYEDAIALTIVNTLGHEYTGPVQGLVRVPKMFMHDNYTLIDSYGKVIPARICHITDKQKDLESVYMTNQQLSVVLSKNAGLESKVDQVFTVLEVDFTAENIPGIGYKTFWLKPGVENSTDKLGVWLNENGMENERLLVDFNDDGTINIKDKLSGYMYEGLSHFIDREDTGSSYDYHGFSLPEEFDTRKYKINWTVFETYEHKITFKAFIPLELPEKLDGNNRSTVLKYMPITLFATLHAGVARLDITVELDNVCKDHCLRVAFDTGLNTGKISAYDHFNVLERNIHLSNKEWIDSPFQEFVDISDGKFGLCISTKGLPAYEAVKSERGTLLYLTLLRSVGSIGPAAGANYPVSGAQCQKKFRFEYSIIPHKGDWLQEDCLRKAADYRTQPLIEADVQHKGPLSSSGSFIEVTCEGGIVPFYSCLKQSEDGTGLILRMWNPGDCNKVSVQSNYCDKKIQLTNLDEIILDDGAYLGGEVFMPSRSLITFKIT